MFKVLGVALLACSTWANAASFSYTGLPVPIPDSPAANVAGSLVSAPITVSGLTQPIAKVTLSIDGAACTATAGATTVGIDHSFVNDLQVSLRSPSGTSVLIINRTDGGGNNLCQVTLDDESAGPSIQTVQTASAPFAGNYTPNAPLSAFAGQSANGIWELQAQDFFIGDTGSIRAWTINITEAIAQTINFTSTAPASAVIGNSYSVNATGGGSGNPVVFTIDPTASATCSIAGNAVTLAAAGTCTINANQAGNSQYIAAPQVQQSFAVSTVPIKPMAVPTLSGWGLGLLIAMAGVLGLRTRRKA